MSRKTTPGSYSFATATNDLFHRRVAKEAKGRHRFLLLHARNPYAGTTTIDLLVRTDTLARCKDAAIDFVIDELVEKAVITRTGFTRLSFGQYKDADAKRLLNKLEGLIHHAKNYLNGRHLRVTVQAL